MEGKCLRNGMEPSGLLNGWRTVGEDEALQGAGAGRVGCRNCMFWVPELESQGGLLFSTRRYRKSTQIDTVNPYISTRK